MELIKIKEHEGRKTVNARDLWEFLEVKTKYSDWVNRRILEYDFIQNIDFITVLKNETSPPTKLCFMSLDMAKELSMVERNEKGKKARQYFIECERQIKELTPAEMLLKQSQLMVEQERKMLIMNNRLDLIEAKQTTRQENFFTVAGYCSLKRIQVSQLQAADLGRKCAKLSREKEYKVESVPDARFGRVNIYHTDILEKIVC
jgi:phage anti-repressor protein